MSKIPSILITAGPTHEPIDPVRYLANRSSGRLGLALATAAATAGCSTRLLVGPVVDEPPPGVAIDRFQSTVDLQKLLAERFPDADLLIMAAAVADFRPATFSETKIGRGNEGLDLRLEPTPDLVAECTAAKRPDQRVVGFALDDGPDLARAARSKLVSKKLDAVVANPLRTMGGDDIEATVCTAGGVCVSLGRQSKASFATWLIDQLVSGRLWDTSAASARSNAP